jgi:uncharacterized membrane protein YphA (DoxX/SURF4 family)
MDETATATAEPLATKTIVDQWNLAERVLFRFAFCYFVLYTWPAAGRVSLYHKIPGGYAFTTWVNQLLQGIVPWIATHVFGVTGMAATYSFHGSGDTTLSYITALLFFVLALVATLVWSVLDRRRPNYVRLHFWFRVLLRYTLAVTLFTYGFNKVFPNQFSPPDFLRLIEPFGEFSPMGVLWSFMGASVPYVIFTGACEVVAGALLVFRRTTLLGALVSAAVMVNVVVLNLCYDVPVKLYSTHLLLMAILLAAPDLTRLFDFFVRNRAVGRDESEAFPFSQPSLRRAAVVGKVLFLGLILLGQILGGIDGLQRREATPRSPLYGLYDVESFEQNGVAEGKPSTWRKVVMQYPNVIAVRTNEDAVLFLQANFDVTQSAITIRNRDRLVWSRPDSARVVLEGKIGDAPVRIWLKVVDVDKMLLKSRGFHWINERPFNR